MATATLHDEPVKTGAASGRRLVDGLLPRSVVYYSATIAAGMLGLVKSFCYAKVLGSEALGLYALGVLISTYWQACVELGLCRGLECQLPKMYGAGQTLAAEQLRNQVAGTLLVVSLCLMPFFSVVCLLIPAPDATSKLVAILAGWLSTTTLFVSLSGVDLRGRGDLVQLGLLTFARTIGNLVLGITAGIAFGAPGVLAAETLVAALVFVSVSNFACERFRFEFVSPMKLKALYCVGLPVTFRNLTNHLSHTLDRWCVVAALGILAFGQYAFAMLIVTANELLVAAVWSHVGPQAAQLYGRTGDVRVALRLLSKRTRQLVLLSVAAWFAFQWFVDLLVATCFVEYQVGGELMKILYWGSAAQLIGIFEWIPMATGRTLVLLWLSLGSALLSGCLYAWAFHAQWSIVALAWIFVLVRVTTAGGQYAAAVWLTRTIPLANSTGQHLSTRASLPHDQLPVAATSIG
jgi:O-antigen/teichoic acid export membrane protein